MQETVTFTNFFSVGQNKKKSFENIFDCHL